MVNRFPRNPLQPLTQKLSPPVTAWGGAGLIDSANVTEKIQWSD
jgi:hypothetical protein